MTPYRTNRGLLPGILRHPHRLIKRCVASAFLLAPFLLALAVILLVLWWLRVV